MLDSLCMRVCMQQQCDHMAGSTGGKKFEMHSDEFNGKAVDDVYCGKFGDCVADPGNPIDPAIANKRPNLPRTLTIDQAIQQNLEGRVYLGVHWRFDQTAGGQLGRAVANSVVNGFPYRG